MIFGEELQKVAKILKESDYTIALTGAGISVPSGIPDFRSPGTGLWEKADPAKVGSIWGFMSNPKRFYNWIAPLVEKILQAEPNPAHLALTELQKMGLLREIITQNIDFLHEKAGSTDIIHLHGDISSGVCTGCGEEFPSDDFWPEVLNGEVPACPQCNNVVKPNVVLFGEPLPPGVLTQTWKAAEKAEAIIVVGSSLEVTPASNLPKVVHSNLGKVIIFNLGQTTSDPIAHVKITGDASEHLPRLIKVLKN